MSEKMYELTNPQKSIWLTEQYYNGTAINNICGSLLVREKLNVELFNLAINKFIENNDSFRLHFTLKNGVPYQYLVQNEFINFEVVDLKDEKDISSLADVIVKVPFTFYDSKLFDFKIFKLENGFGGFVVNVHHIISDAATLSFVGTEIMDIYASLINNVEIPSKSFSYIDYINSEKDYIESNRFKKDKEYWNNLLSPLPEVATIPSNKNEKDSPASNRAEFSFDAKLLDSINDFCKQYKISMYNFLIAIYSIYIGRINNMDVFTLGTPILNRTSYAEKHTSGMFISTSLLKIDTTDNLSFIEFAQNIAKDCMGMLRHQKYNYQHIIEDFRKDNNDLPNLYDILLSYQITKATDSNCSVPYQSAWHGTPFVGNSIDIHFHDNNDTGNLSIDYDYKTCKYDYIDIENMHNRILHIINQILDKAKINIHDIDIVTEKEKNQILYEFNDTDFNFNLNKKSNIYTHIELEAKKFPNSIALEDSSTSLSYKELISRVNKLSSYLLENFNIKPNTAIGILANKNIDTIIGILAILKLNCTIVPIDANYPIERINYMISNSNISTILVTNNFELNNTYQLIDISYEKYCSFEAKKNNLKINYDIDNTLYIIFTSGSTGKPKGVSITHKNILNLIYFEKKFTQLFSKQRRVLQFATLSFDVSYQEIFSALCTASTLVLIDDSTKKDRIKLTDYIILKQIDTLFISPKYLMLLVEDNKKFLQLSTTLKNVITAGEQLIINDSIKRIIQLGVNVHNHYGPSETHVCTTYVINSNSQLCIKPPIGKPISNSNIYILDSYKKLLPIGCVGNLYISGDCVGKGYINRDDLTKEKFIKDPFTSKFTMYNSGDLAKYDEQGNVIYLGRSDFQVKVNGFRIELEEIEHAILKLPYICSVYVTNVKNEFEKNTLLAFVKVSNSCLSLNIKEDLAKFLPKYMIPSIFYEVNEIPLNHNGKTDKKYLLQNINKFHIISKQTQFSNKSITPLEKQLLKAFCKVLNNPNLSITDDFFDFGGDSLAAIALQAECSKINLFFNTQELYDNPSVKQLSKHLIDSKKDIDVRENFKVKLEPKKVNIKKINNIFVTGANGFLGIHVLDSLLKTDNIIYCLVRSTPTKSSVQRFLDFYKYYFDKDLSSYINKKIYIIDGDLSKETFNLDPIAYKKLANKIDIIINCAASVKHYTTRKYNYDNNVSSTINLLNFSKTGNCLFNHISTIGLAGNDLVNTNFCFKNSFSEDDLDINQDYSSNVYIETKYKAEKLILEYIDSHNISANIIRVGNLMNRYSDNKFQIDIKSNAFQNKMKAIISLGIAPVEFKNFQFDITPVDLCAEAVTKLALNNSYNNIYHVLNSRTMYFDDLKNIFSKLGVKIKLLKNDEIHNMLKDSNENQVENYKWILNDLILNNKNRISIDSRKTQHILYTLGFNWDIINDKYYQKVFKFILKGDD